MPAVAKPREMPARIVVFERGRVMRVRARLAIILAIILTAFLVVFPFAFAYAADLRLVGAGASFPFPLYSSWFKEFSRKTPGVTVDYQAKGSGAGIQDLINKTVDFAASDAAMTP